MYLVQILQHTKELCTCAVTVCFIIGFLQTVDSHKLNLVTILIDVKVERAH